MSDHPYQESIGDEAWIRREFDIRSGSIKPLETAQVAITGDLEYHRSLITDVLISDQ